VLLAISPAAVAASGLIAGPSADLAIATLFAVSFVLYGLIRHWVFLLAAAACLLGIFVSYRVGLMLYPPGSLEAAALVSRPWLPAADAMVLLPLAAFGAWATRDAWPRRSDGFAALLLAALAVGVFLTVERLRFAVLPVASLFAGAGIAAAGRFMAMSTRDRVVALSAAAAVAVLAYIPIPKAFPTPNVFPIPVTSTTRDASSGSGDRALLEKGIELAESGRLGPAVEMLRRAATQEPDNADAHYALGVTLSRSGDDAGAVRALEEAARLRPDSRDVRYALGYSYSRTGRTADARRAFEEALALARAAGGDAEEIARIERALAALK
jgi:tetratricopeptide (TPR) repeat protein